MKHEVPTIVALDKDQLPNIKWKDKKRHNKKPPWTKNLRCLCGVRKLRLIFGAEDGMSTPKKLRCCRCKYETQMYLTSDQCKNQLERDKDE